VYALERQTRFQARARIAELEAGTVRPDRPARRADTPILEGDRLGKLRRRVQDLEREVREWRDVWGSPDALRHLHEVREEENRRQAEEFEFLGVQVFKHEPPPHEVLGLSPDATPAEVKARYRELVKQLHPDRNDGNRDGEERMREVVNAYRNWRCSRSDWRYSRSARAWAPGVLRRATDFGRGQRGRV
jgi:hypothetical protein